MAMKDQAKLLEDLTAAISSMKAKLDEMHPVVLDLKSWRPVESLCTEVGDPRLCLIDTTRTATTSPTGSDLPPLLERSADEPPTPARRKPAALALGGPAMIATPPSMDGLQSIPAAEEAMPVPVLPSREDAQVVLVSMSKPLGQPQNAAATVMDYKDAQESAISLTIQPSSWYDQFLIPRVLCSVSLHVRMVWAQHRMVIHLEQRPAWPPPSQINFSGFSSVGQFDADATTYWFHWNPGGSWSGDLRKATCAIISISLVTACHVTSVPMQLGLRSLWVNLICTSFAPSFPRTDCWKVGIVAPYLKMKAIGLNQHISLTYWKVVMFSTIGLQSWFVQVLINVVEQVSSLQHATGDSGQQVDVSHDQFSGTNLYSSWFPGYFVTGGQRQDCIACSTLHLCLWGLVPSFHPVVMCQLQLSRSGSHGVYLQELQMDRSGTKGDTLDNISINENLCQLKWSESILAYPTDMAPYCSIFSNAPDQCTDQCTGSSSFPIYMVHSGGSCVFPCAKEPREVFCCMQPWCLWKMQCIQQQKLDWNNCNLCQPCVCYKYYVLLDSGNWVALSYKYLSADSTDCVGLWLFPGCFVVACQESSVHSSSDYLISKETIFGVLGIMDWHPFDSPCRSAVTACLSYPQEIDHYFYSSQLKKVLMLDLRTRLDVSYDLLFSCANQYTSGFPRYFVTDNQMQDLVECSTLHWFLYDFSLNFCLVVMLELQLAGSGSHGVYLQKLQMDISGIKRASLNSISIIVNRFRLKWSESNTAYSVDMAVYCSSFSCTCEEMCALLIGFLILNGARIKSERSNGDISTHATKFVIAAEISQSITVHSGFDTVEARGLLFWRNKEGVQSLEDPYSRRFAGHGFVLMCLLEELLLLAWQPPISSCSITNGMFMNDESPSLVIWELWLLNHHDMIQMQIVCQPTVHACFANIELSYEDNESRCRLYRYHGGPEVLSLLTFDRQGLFPGGRCGMISSTPYLALDNYIDYLTSLSYNGLKVLQVPWDPGVCKFSVSASLRASRMLRRGECHGPCGLLRWVARAAAKRA